eukprot:7272718-Alexandrium_andersonii.AAC.1
MRDRSWGPYYGVALVALLVGGPADWPSLPASRPRAAGLVVRGHRGQRRPPQAWAGAALRNE